MNVITNKIYTKGDRVKYSQEALNEFKTRFPDRLGTVIGIPKNSNEHVIVWWDNTARTSAPRRHISRITKANID